MVNCNQRVYVFDTAPQHFDLGVKLIYTIMILIFKNYSVQSRFFYLFIEDELVDLNVHLD